MCTTCGDTWCEGCRYALPNDPITDNAPIVSASSLIAHSVHTAGILIDEVYVAASERKKGLARAMIKHVIQTNPQATHVYLIVRNMRAQQKAAVKLYKDIGMKYVPRSDHAAYTHVNPGTGHRIMKGEVEEMLRKLAKSQPINTSTLEITDIARRREPIWTELREHHMCKEGDRADVRKVILEADCLTTATLTTIDLEPAEKHPQLAQIHQPTQPNQTHMLHNQQQHTQPQHDTSQSTWLTANPTPILVLPQSQTQMRPPQDLPQPHLQHTCQPTPQHDPQPIWQPNLQLTPQHNWTPPQSNQQTTWQLPLQPNLPPTTLQPNPRTTLQPTLQYTQQPTMQPNRQATTQHILQPTQPPIMDTTLTPDLLLNPYLTTQPTPQPISQPTPHHTQLAALQHTWQTDTLPTPHPTWQPNITHPVTYPTPHPDTHPTTHPATHPTPHPTHNGNTWSQPPQSQPWDVVHPPPTLLQAHVAEIDPRSTMCAALRAASRPVLSHSIIEQINAKSDTQLKLMCNDSDTQHHRYQATTATKRRAEDTTEGDEAGGKPARRTRGTLRWSERALRAYIVDTHDNDMETT